MFEFVAAPPAVQVALPSTLFEAVAALLGDAGAAFAAIDPENLIVDTGVAPLDRRPLLLTLENGCIGGTTLDAREAVAKLSEIVPIIAILDVDALDEAASILDIEGTSLLIWPSEAGVLLRMLQSFDVDSEFRGALRERDQRQFQLGLLSDEIGRIAERLASLASAEHGMTSSPSHEPERDALATSRFIREIIRRRRARSQFFPADLFADPAWDIMLDLAAARLEGKRVSISSLCIAADVPTTTALRWIKGMTDAGILVRRDDPDDGRRSFVDLSDDAAEAMNAYLGMVEDGVI